MNKSNWTSPLEICNKHQRFHGGICTDCRIELEQQRDALLALVEELLIRDDGHFIECPCPNDYSHIYMPHSGTVKICARVQSTLARVRGA